MSACSQCVHNYVYHSLYAIPISSTYYLKVASGLPVNDHLWGVVDVFGSCTKIKSELLSGELDGIAFMLSVCMYF